MFNKIIGIIIHARWLASTACLALVLTAFGSYPVAAASSCNADHVSLVEKLFYEGFSGGNMKVLDEVFSEDILFVDPMFPEGLEGIKALVKKNNDSFDDWHFTMHLVLCDDDKVTVRWSGKGRHVNSFMGESPTGNQVELNGISIYQIESNKIVADWVVPDNLGFLMQIGVLAPTDMTKGH